MLTRQTGISPRQEYYADSLLTVPTVSDTIGRNFSASFSTPQVMADDVADTLSKKPSGNAMRDTLAAVEMENQTPGMSWLQRQAGNVASLIGYGVNPIMWGFGEIGALGARGVTAAAEKFAPTAVSTFARTPLKDVLSQPLSKWLPEKAGTLSTALLGEKAAKSFGIFAGAEIPAGVVENYNNDKNHINWGGVARDAGEMGAFGVAIGSVPFALGMMKGKINRSLGEERGSDIDSMKLEKALQSGVITPDEHKWYMDWLEHEKSPGDSKKLFELQNRASEIINQNGGKADVSKNETRFDMLKADDIERLQSVSSDELVSDVPENYQNALSGFVIRNGLDILGNNPALFDGVDGYVEWSANKLAEKSSKLEEANSILDNHLLKSVKENMPLSQKGLLKYMRQAGFEKSHMSQLPVTIPENISNHLKLREDISRLKSKLKKSERKSKLEGISEYKPNRQTIRRIDELEKKIPKILTPKEELMQLRKSILSENGLKKGWERSRDYHRLVDLSQVWHNAKTLLDRVHLERDYEQQQAFHDLLKQVLDIHDSDMPKLADPDNVINYLKARIERNMNKETPVSDIQEKTNESLKVPADSETILKDQTEMVKNSKAKFMNEDFESASEKFTEFKSRPEVFKNYIACVLGGLSGQG